MYLTRNRKGESEQEEYLIFSRVVNKFFTHDWRSSLVVLVGGRSLGCWLVDGRHDWPTTLEGIFVVFRRKLIIFA